MLVRIKNMISRMSCLCRGAPDTTIPETKRLDPTLGTSLGLGGGVWGVAHAGLPKKIELLISQNCTYHYGVPFVSKFIVGRHLEKWRDLDIILRKSQWKI